MAAASEGIKPEWMAAMKALENQNQSSTSSDAPQNSTPTPEWSNAMKALESIKSPDADKNTGKKENNSNNSKEESNQSSQPPPGPRDQFPPPSGPQGFGYGGGGGGGGAGYPHPNVGYGGPNMYQQFGYP